MLTEERDQVMAAQRAAKHQAEAERRQFTNDDARAAGRTVFPSLPDEALDSCYTLVMQTEPKHTDSTVKKTSKPVRSKNKKKKKAKKSARRKSRK
jgi:hypothetical protein